MKTTTTGDELRAELERIKALEDDRQINALIRELKNPGQIATLSARGQAAMRLGNLRAQDAAEPLVELLSDPDAHIRRIAARSLGMIGNRSPNVTAGLLEAIRADPNERVQVQAIESLGEIGEPSVVASLLPLLSAKSTRIRRAAIYALAISDDPEATALAEEQLRRDRWSPKYSKRYLRQNIARFRRDGSGAHLVREIRSGKKPAAPQFTLPVLWAHDETWPTDARRALVDGQLSLRELRGHVIVINFWASWCGPCKDEAPLLAASARSHSGKVVFLGIDVQDFKSDARKFLKRFDTPYVSVRAGGGKYDVYNDYGLTGVPETYWLDVRGRIVDHYPGQISRGQLEGKIREAVMAR